MSMFSSPDLPTPIPAPVPDPEPAAGEAVSEAKARNARRRGYSANRLISPLGASNFSSIGGGKPTLGA